MSYPDPYQAIPMLLGGFIVSFGLVSMIIKEWFYLSEAMVATFFGILIGPRGFQLIDPSTFEGQDRLLLELARYVIAIQVMAAGVNLPKAYLYKEWKSLLVLLLPVMFIMWLLGASVMYYFLNLSFLEALLIAACITPTDPVLANSIVQGKFAENHVPEHVRNIISAESGANDGLGFPYVFFPLLLIRYQNSNTALIKWVDEIWIQEILLSCVLGALIGILACKLLQYSQRKNIIDKESFLVFSIALTLFIMGALGIMKSDDLLACFIAGNSFTWDDWFRVETKGAKLQEVVDMMFNLSFFIWFGVNIPWISFTGSLNPSNLLLMSLIILVVRRLPAVVAMKRFIPALHTYEEAVFAGWFGPVGVGAVFYAMVAKEELLPTGMEAKVREMVFPVCSFVILTSLVLHGMTVPLFKLTSSLDPLALTNYSAITQLVSRLPKLKDHQIFVVEHDNDHTEVYIEDSIPVPYVRPSSVVCHRSTHSTNSRKTLSMIFDSRGNLITSTVPNTPDEERAFQFGLSHYSNLQTSGSNGVAQSNYGTMTDCHDNNSNSNTNSNNATNNHLHP